MVKKREGLRVSADLDGIFNEGKARANHRENFTIDRALDIVIKQMEAEGLRPRTISDYRTHIAHYMRITNIEFMRDIDVDSIYEWIASMNVQSSTKLIRLKCFKAFLERCYDNNWFIERFWRKITIHVDMQVKEGATENDVFALLRILDLTEFVQLRDAVSVLIIFETGIRLSTLSNLEEHHVDLDERLLKLPGSIMKNRHSLVLPFSERLARLLAALFEQNRIIRKEKKKLNDFVLITQNGGKIMSSHASNNVSKRLNMYKRRYGLENINPHALRRGFAKDIYKRSDGDLAIVSKALGHQDFGVTARYLHLDEEEVVKELRKYRR